MADIVMAYMLMAYIVMAFMVMAYMLMAYIVMAFMVMAYAVVLQDERHFFFTSQRSMSAGDLTAIVTGAQLLLCVVVQTRHRG